jgi:hypothetical protein
MKDQTIANVIFCCVLVLIESLQVLIVLVLVFSFFPIPPSPLLQHLFSRQLAEVFPKRDMFFYHFFVGLAIAGQIALLTICRKQLSSSRFMEQWRPFFLVEAGWLFLMVFAVFKFFVYGYAGWAKHFLYAVIAASVLSKIFFKELKVAGSSVYAYILRKSAAVSLAVSVLFPMLIAFIIFVPDLQAVVARMWIGDAIIHMDTSLMGQAWAYTKGIKLNVDIYSPYGVGMTVFISLISKILGGLSYEKVEGILIAGTIVYFIFCFFFLRAWLKNVWLAMAGVLLAIKWQMFHQGAFPFVFTYPYSTVVRFWFDVTVLFLLLAHRRGQFYFLPLAGAVCGLGLLHITDTGVYLLIAYLFYLAWWAFEKVIYEKDPLKDILGNVLLCLAAVLVSALIWFYVCVGSSVWSKIFWKHMLERADFFFIGHGNLPMYKSLIEGDYGSSLMSFVVPLAYCGTFLTVVSLIILKKIDRQHILAALLCVYGLGLYHYHVLRSGNTSFYAVCIPFVFVLCWLAQIMMGNMTQRHRTWSGCILLAGSAFALFSNHGFLSYPNVFNFSADPIVAPTVAWPNKNLPFYFNNTPKRYPESFKLPANSLGEKDEDLRTEADFKTDKELKEYFGQEFDFKQDAQLIDQLTSPSEPVALMSSFEVGILMQADRKPFFYYFPLVLSRPMRMRMFGFSILWSSDQLAQIMAQLEKSKPDYVFMEKVFLARQVPQTYLYLFPEELVILSYLDKNYKPYQFGKYLVALKRI